VRGAFYAIDPRQIILSVGFTIASPSSPAVA
jgi:hypothetical protein